MKKLIICAFAWMIGLAAVAQPRTLSKAECLDKMKGAWAGQMIGVCYGAPYEFQYNGVPIIIPLEPWKPERIEGAIGQDDIYVEMTFLEALQEHGIDITFEQAGAAFGKSEYPLWHANKVGRENIRQGIMPPDSGKPEFNKHADDIDFQIEADLLGILCPGMPQESNRLCDVFGHIMNYGDGVYGGMFVAGMYAAAYFEPEDVPSVIEAGLACIPAESTYHQCISDVIRWHAENPENWLETWTEIEEKWQTDVDCLPGNPVNIDAKLNGAYIVVGMLYGGGDMLRTVEIATRCGQDSDCNASNAAGVLGCMKGFAALGDFWTSGIPKMADEVFAFTQYSFNTLIPACQAVTEKIVERAGGEIGAEEYRIAIQEPVPPATLEQWTGKAEVLTKPITDAEMARWDPQWRVVACGHDMEPGVRAEEYGRESVLVIHPLNREEPAVIEGVLSVPDRPEVRLLVDIASNEQGDFLLRIMAGATLLAEQAVDTQGTWTTIEVSLEPYRGKETTIRIENRATDWNFEAAYLDAIRVE